MTVPNKKLLLVIPYRDRAEHLKVFLPYATRTLNKQNIPHKIAVVEQSQHKLFNRGLLINIGFHLLHQNYDYLCVHDVDMIGEDFDYCYEKNCVTHLSFKRRVDKEYKQCYNRYLGGVVLFTNEQYLTINGFGNNYWGWGCEDDDLRLRCDAFGLKILRKACHYYTLPHPDTGYMNPMYMTNYHLMVQHFKASKPDRIQLFQKDGLNQCDQYFTLESIVDLEDHTRINVTVE